MIVAGIMSGTSADGVDVAICRITAGRTMTEMPRLKLLGHMGSKYTKAVRTAVLGAMNAEAISVPELGRLNWRLGAVYADTVEKAAAKFGVKIELVACHGQTIYHQGTAAIYAGKPVRATWQMGEASVIAERLRLPVVSDFRPADMAAGGQGAPLVPMLDYTMFSDAKKSRVLLNLGGIANLTALPAGAVIDNVMAFDTGPANMVIDGCMQRLFGKSYDRGGATARRGAALGAVVEEIMQDEYFSALPPKSCGREQFGEALVTRFIAMCRQAGAKDEDVIATAAALTAESVIDAYRRFVWAHLVQAAPLAKVEFVAAGGGVKNATLMGMLGAALKPLGVNVRTMDEFGVPAQAKEAVAFALLGWMSWNRLPGNVPSATGAKRAVVLGRVTFG
jgi:anhydro-N-acetylmuramic acid kinase